MKDKDDTCRNCSFNWRKSQLLKVRCLSLWIYVSQKGKNYIRKERDALVRETPSTIVIVKISIPKASQFIVLENVLIFGKKYVPQRLRLLEGGGGETLFRQILFECAIASPGSSLIRPTGWSLSKIFWFLDNTFTFWLNTVLTSLLALFSSLFQSFINKIW